MRRIEKIPKILSVLALLLSGGIFGITAYTDATLPNCYYVIEGQELELEQNIPINIENHENDKTLKMAEASAGTSYNVDLKLFGLFPVKTARVNVVDEMLLTPGGMPFGIKMFTEGVLVVGLSEIQTQTGTVNPAKQAGIHVSDIILSINGESISGNDDISERVENSGGRNIKILIKRNNLTFTLSVKPEKSKADGKFKAGIWVRDSSAGIGTVTYYNTKTGVFGGLGHAVCDVDTGDILPLHSGEIVRANIGGITKGSAGKPGELRGSFINDRPIGTLLSNNQTGVFGVMYNIIGKQASIPVAMKQDVKLGAAKIITTTSGTTPQEYDIRIERVSLNDSNLTKNMVIKIVDERLLEEAGGIVQGMSGSPIIQNGKLIGAVTHVFVNEPQKGYGIFIENMILTSNNIEKKIAEKAS